MGGMVKRQATSDRVKSSKAAAQPKDDKNHAQDKSAAGAPTNSRKSSSAAKADINRSAAENSSSSPSKNTAPKNSKAAPTDLIRQYELVDMVKAYDPQADEDLLNRAYVYAMKAMAGRCVSLAILISRIHWRWRRS